MIDEPLRSAFSSHPRRWREFLYAYPVISRRSKGLSIGINLNPDASCNFRCVYCCADRSLPRSIGQVDLEVLEAELRHLIGSRDSLFDEPEFREIPAAFRRLNDIALSGDGEPTAVPVFGDVVRVAVAVREDLGLDHAKLIVITNASCLTRPDVADALRLLDRNNGEIWAKLDAGTEEYFQRVCRAAVSLEHVLGNILNAARERPVVLQSLFMCLHGQPTPKEEIEAYLGRLRWLLENGARIALVQVYSVARRTAEAHVTPLDAAELQRIADEVRALGISVETYE